MTEDEILDKAIPNAGHRRAHGEPCARCGDKINALAGNALRWPVSLFTRKDQPGVIQWYCMGCSSEAMMALENKEWQDYLTGTEVN